MREKMRFWTPEETEKARELVKSLASNQECVDSINRTRYACRARIRYVDNEYVRIKMSSKGKNRIRKGESKGINHMAEKPRGIPDEVMEDARRRAAAPRTLTSLVFGDPAPGSSALDKQRSAA